YDAANPYPNADTNGEIPRRFRYPSKESQDNAANYEAAVSRLSGGDHFSSRIWWDVAK
ncbi:SusD/RagB family nutrient-binding outer membrane lipoprotein, partial [Parabacteroides merdae]